MATSSPLPLVNDLENDESLSSMSAELDKAISRAARESEVESVLQPMDDLSATLPDDCITSEYI